MDDEVHTMSDEAEEDCWSVQGHSCQIVSFARSVTSEDDSLTINFNVAAVKDDSHMEMF